MIKGKYSVRPQHNKEINENNDTRLLQFSYIAILEVFLLGFPMLLYLAIKYFGKGEPYGDFSIIILTLGFIAVGGILAFQREKITKIQTYYLENTIRIEFFLIYTFGIVILLGIAWWILGSVLKFGLTATELYFYYLGCAIMEEIFFRMFLCGILKTKVFNRLKRQFSNLIENLIISVITGIIFALSHITTYGFSITCLSIMFIGGLVFGMFYLYTKDISIPITAHLIINFISVGRLLMGV